MASFSSCPFILPGGRVLDRDKAKAYYEQARKLKNTPQDREKDKKKPPE